MVRRSAPSWLARSASLAHKAVDVLIYEGPRTLLWRLSLWTRKHWYYTRGRRVAARALGLADTSGAHVSPSAAPKAPARGAPRHPGAFRVLFIVPIEDPFSKRYRVDNVRAQLSQQCIATDAVYDVDVGRRLAYALGFDAIVFHRIAASPQLRRFAALAQDREVALIFDVDDYIFEPSMLASIPALDDVPAAEKLRLSQQVHGCRAMLDLCESFIGSTHFLAERAQALGHRAFVIRNGLSERQVVLAQAALARRKQRPTANAPVRVGYLSGTRTHEKDFAVAVPALCRLLEECPQVILVIRGLLDVPPLLLSYGRRIELRPYVSWERLVGATAELDVTIAPLDLGNPFTEGKSALKYFESALVGVPVVASPTEEFRRSIRHGVNGFLAGTDDEWFTSLHLLVNDRAQREWIGNRARADALRNYTPKAQSVDTLQVFQAILKA